MPKASNIQPDKNISILLKGAAGFGKTIAACSFAEFGPIWLAYWDKRTPAEVYTFYTRIGRKDILENIEYDCYSAVNANEYLNKLFMLARNPGQYIAGITDSVTYMTAGAVNWSMGFRTPGGKKDTSNPNSPSVMPGMDEYKLETSFVTQAIDICKALPWFNIWTAHPLPVIKMDGNEQGKVEKVSKANAIVSYGSKVAGLIPGGFTEIYHCGIVMGKRTYQTIGRDDEFAKTSLNLPTSFVVPEDGLFAVTWKDLVNKAFQELEPKKEEPKLSIDNVVTSPKWKV